MVTPNTTTNKSAKFDGLYKQSGSPVSSNTRKSKKAGRWTKGQSAPVSTDKKVQDSSEALVTKKDVTVDVQSSSSSVVAKKVEAKKQDDIKTTVVSTPILVQSDDYSSEIQSTASSQLLAKIADIVESRLPEGRDQEAAQILEQSDDQILEWIVATMGSKKKDDSEVVIAPSIDPKLYEEQQQKIASLMAELQKQSNAVSSLKVVLKGREEENKQLQHQANQAKLHILTLTQSVRKLNPDDDTNIGDTVSDEYISQATQDIETEMGKLEVLYGLSSDLDVSSSSQLKAKSSEKIAEPTNIPCNEDVTKLFSLACILQKEVELEAKKLETKDTRPMASVQDLFSSFISQAQGLTNNMLLLKKELDKDLHSIQQEIQKKITATYSKAQREGVEIISSFYTAAQFSEDIKRHFTLLNQMRSELKDVVTHYVSTVEMLNNITHNIAVALADCDTSETDDTIMEVSSTLNKLPIDIESITCPEVKESVIGASFSNIYLAINTFQTMVRKKRLAITDLTVPSDQALKAKFLDGLKHLANIQKLHLIELDKIWNKVSPHVLNRKDELEKEVNKGNQNVKLSQAHLVTVANYLETTPNDFEQNKILPYDIAHLDRDTTLHELNTDLKNLFTAATLAKQEANRTYDAFTRSGSWTTESWWLLRGYHDQEVTDLFKND
jgi:hypothetical protein